MFFGRVGGGAGGGGARKINIGGAANSDSKTSKVAQRPVDAGPPLTLREIQIAPVIWAKLSGYSWWPARVSSFFFLFVRKRKLQQSIIHGT